MLCYIVKFAISSKSNYVSVQCRWKYSVAQRILVQTHGRAEMNGNCKTIPELKLAEINSTQAPI